VRFVRVLYSILVLGSGALLLWLEPGPSGFVLLAAGLLVLLASFLLEARIRRSAAAAREMLSGGFGLLLGLLIGMVALAAVDELPLVEFVSTNQTYVASVVSLLFLLMLGFVGLAVGQAVARDFRLPQRRRDDPPIGRTSFLIGQRGLIDGRVLRLAQSPLLAGEIVIPRYVVDSLQTMAASRSPLDHFRGERGLENLRTLQQIPNRSVRIREIDILKGEVQGLLDFAQGTDTRILTQDETLLAEAARRGIPTIDLNQLADLLKPEVVQGDELVVKLVKPGKEREQAVGYMEDGNMVVVENAREDVGKTVRITVTGIHQTRAGTLIFGNKKEVAADGARLSAARAEPPRQDVPGPSFPSSEYVPEGVRPKPQHPTLPHPEGLPQESWRSEPHRRETGD
jgi:uncharacterized protein YacL